MVAEGNIRENLHQQMENLNKFTKFNTKKNKPLYDAEHVHVHMYFIEYENEEEA